MEFESQISFLYYKDLDKAIKFYEEIFKFEKTVDQGWAKIYRTVNGAHIGLVEETKGFLNWQKDKTVMITLVTKELDGVDKWYEYLQKHDVKFLSKPHDIDEINIRGFLLEDPEGYVIEIQHFL
ncbi:MAG: VOC family protein [Candidatus Heimdallarchaeota archaeon]